MGRGGDSARALCTCNHLHMCSVVHEVELIFKCVSRQRFMFACGVENFTIFDLVSPSKLYHKNIFSLIAVWNRSTLIYMFIFLHSVQ